MKMNIKFLGIVLLSLLSLVSCGKKEGYLHIKRPVDWNFVHYRLSFDDARCQKGSDFIPSLSDLSLQQVYDERGVLTSIDFSSYQEILKDFFPKGVFYLTPFLSQKKSTKNHEYQVKFCKSSASFGHYSKESVEGRSLTFLSLVISIVKKSLKIFPSLQKKHITLHLFPSISRSGPFSLDHHNAAYYPTLQALAIYNAHGHCLDRWMQKDILAHEFAHYIFHFYGPNSSHIMMDGLNETFADLFAYVVNKWRPDTLEQIKRSPADLRPFSSSFFTRSEQDSHALAQELAPILAAMLERATSDLGERGRLLVKWISVMKKDSFFEQFSTNANTIGLADKRVLQRAMSHFLQLFPEHQMDDLVNKYLPNL